ncbi:MAG TPA: hypothetical protein VGI17_12790 [Solirubrobacterales bacterium]|jgi:hypothetical protein
MADSTSPPKRTGDTPPRPEPDPLFEMRPEISRAVIGSPQEWFRRIKRRFGNRAA